MSDDETTGDAWIGPPGATETPRQKHNIQQPNTPAKRSTIPANIDTTGDAAVAPGGPLFEDISQEEPVPVEQAPPIIQIRRKLYANTYKTGLGAGDEWDPRGNIILRRDDRALNGRPVYDGMTLVLGQKAKEFYSTAHQQMREEHEDDPDFHLTLLAPLSFLYVPDAALLDWLKEETGVYATNLHTEALLDLKKNAVYREVEKNLPVHARGNTLPCSVNGHGARMEHVRQAAPLTIQAVTRANSYVQGVRPGALDIAKQHFMEKYVYYILEVYAHTRMVDSSTRFQINARTFAAQRANRILVMAIKGYSARTW